MIIFCFNLWYICMYLFMKYTDLSTSFFFFSWFFFYFTLKHLLESISLVRLYFVLHGESCRLFGAMSKIELWSFIVAIFICLQFNYLRQHFISVSFLHPLLCDKDEDRKVKYYFVRYCIISSQVQTVSRTCSMHPLCFISRHIHSWL